MSTVTCRPAQEDNPLNDIILDIKDIEVEAGNVGEKQITIVDKVDLTLRKGEVIGLIGESGAGKSTLGLTVMGYCRPGCRITSGSIQFRGHDLMNASPKEMRELRGVKIAYVAQSAAASFNPAHKLIEQFVEGPHQHGIMTARDAGKKCIDLYGKLKMPQPEVIAYRFPHQVSGGQLQRSMVAMAMACNPDIIIFDEPTTALDVTTQIEVLATIKDVIRQFGMAGVYITHDLAVVAQVADRIKVMRYGKEVEEDTTENIINHPSQDYTRELLASRSLVRDRQVDNIEDDILLSVEHVSAGYKRGEKILNDVSVTVKKAQTVAVVGESGSGKSTLARVITGLLPAWEGNIIFDHKRRDPDIKQRYRSTLKRMQMIYQMPDTALNPTQKIETILGRPLTFYLNMKGAARRKRVEELLDMIELPKNYINRYPNQLSGGEKQRICIARSIAAEPELVICDEVTSALDQIVAAGILRLLQKLQNELKLSYLFITHDLDTVKAVADEVVVMLNGRVVESGLKDDIIHHPQHEYTKRLLDSVPLMDPTWLDKRLASRVELIAD